MPLLYYGHLKPWETWRKSKLYVPGGHSPKPRKVEVKVFDYFKVDGLAPMSMRVNVANFWWIKQHSAISWHDEHEREHTIFIPGQHEQLRAIEVARIEFPTVVVGALTFRFNNEREIYLYD